MSDLQFQQWINTTDEEKPGFCQESLRSPFPCKPDRHSAYAGKITVSGKDGADAKRYQEKEVQAAIEAVKEREQDD